ncbi:MAG: hypothetical protein AB4038_14940 [Prochloraceae cyanobacterium]
MLFNKPVQLIFCQYPLFNVGLTFFLGLTTTYPFLLLESNLAKSQVKQQTSKTFKTKSSLAQASRSNSPLANGVYLYGQSSLPEQIGKEYLIFEVRQGGVIGAIYMPRSEFYCFYGNLNSQQINLSILDTYENRIYSYLLTIKARSSVSATPEENANSIVIEGYQQINTIRTNDRRILNICLRELE